MNQNFNFNKCLSLSFLAHGLAVGGLTFAVNFIPAKVGFYQDITSTRISIASASSIEPASIARLEQVKFMPEAILQQPQMVRMNTARPIQKQIKRESSNSAKAMLTRKSSVPDQETGGRGAEKKARVSVVRAPKPPYPRLARKAGFEGKVMLDVEVAKDGSVKSCNVLRSSGREDCDNAAVETVRERWRFQPATLNGIPVQSREKIVVVYNLE